MEEGWDLAARPTPAARGRRRVFTRADAGRAFSAGRDLKQMAAGNAGSDGGSRACYWAMRARGHRYERALRGLADRLLACLSATLRDDVLYDPARRARHLTRPLAA